MTQEDKELLLKDLSARLPYKVKCEFRYEEKDCINLHGFVIPVPKINPDTREVEYKTENKVLSIADLDLFSEGDLEIKPYLRPMEGMTKEERVEFSKLLVVRYCEEDWEGHVSTSYCIEIDNVYTDDEYCIKYPGTFSMDAIDWLNARHFDYRGLIKKVLALKAPEGMYNINEN